MKQFFFGLLIVFIIIIASFPFIVFLVYRGPSPDTDSINRWRYSVDSRLKVWDAEDNFFYHWLNASVFQNTDKYVFHPPRIIFGLDTHGGAEVYSVFGIVSYWDPDSKILGLNSYIGKKLFVRFDPSGDGSTAVLPTLDNRGYAITPGIIDYIDRSTVSNWATLFCQSDVIRIDTATRQNITASSQTSPIIPIKILLTQRLCEVNRP